MSMVNTKFEDRTLLTVYLDWITDHIINTNYSHQIHNSTNSVEISAVPHSLLNEDLITDQNIKIKQRIVYYQVHNSEVTNIL